MIPFIVTVQMVVLPAITGLGAQVRTRSGEEVLSRSNLTRGKSGPGFAVLVEVPASALAVGDYELALKGMAADHTNQDVGYYYFGVQRR
jgi:hypothetical protein